MSDKTRRPPDEYRLDSRPKHRYAGHERSRYDAPSGRSAFRLPWEPKANEDTNVAQVTVAAFTAASAGGNRVTLRHGLRRIPVAYRVVGIEVVPPPGEPPAVWHEPADKAAWTNEMITLRVNCAGTYTLEVY